MIKIKRKVSIYHPIQPDINLLIMKCAKRLTEVVLFKPSCKFCQCSDTKAFDVG